MLIMNHAVCVAPQLNMHAQDNTVRSGEPTPNADHDDSRLTRAERAPAGHVYLFLVRGPVEPVGRAPVYLFLARTSAGSEISRNFLPCTSMFSYSVQPAQSLRCDQIRPYAKASVRHTPPVFFSGAAASRSGTHAGDTEHPRRARGGCVLSGRTPKSKGKENLLSLAAEQQPILVAARVRPEVRVCHVLAQSRATRTPTSRKSRS